MLFSQLLNDITSKKPFFSIILGDFNVRSKCWWSKESDSLLLIIPTSDNSTDKFCDTHITENSLPCIDLIFAQQPNLVIYSEIHASLHYNYHHQITFAHINIVTKYPPHYHR